LGRITGPRWTRGFRKHRLSIVVESPVGKRKTIATATDTLLATERRRKQRLDYVTLVTLRHTPRFCITRNLATGRDSLVAYLNPEIGLAVLNEDELWKLTAYCLYRVSSNSIPLVSKNVIQLLSSEPVIQWYFGQFDMKIKKARRSWFRSARARHRNLGRVRSR
jgi:hypothetical protein